MGGLGIAVTATQALTGQISTTEAIVDGIFGVVGFIGPIGAGINAVYFIGKFAYEGISGDTLFDKPVK